MNWKLILILLSGPVIFFIQACGEFTDSTSTLNSEISSKASTSSDSALLSSQVISELKSNLSSTSSSRSSRSTNTTRVSKRTTSKTLSNNLNSAQISALTDAATEAVQAADMSQSENLIELMPKIIESVQIKLGSLGLANATETTNVVNVIVNSMVQSLKGRTEFLPSSSAETGATSTETVFKKITSTSIANFDESVADVANVSFSDTVTAASEVVGTIVGSMGSSDITSNELGGALEKITSGAVDATDEINGLTPAYLGDVIEKVNQGATTALGDITISGYSSDNLGSMVEKLASGSTSALGSIKMTGFSADNLSSMVEKVTYGATSALGKIKMPR